MAFNMALTFEEKFEINVPSDNWCDSELLRVDYYCTSNGYFNCIIRMIIHAYFLNYSSVLLIIWTNSFLHV